MNPTDYLKKYTKPEIIIKFRTPALNFIYKNKYIRNLNIQVINYLKHERPR
jgi:hypothetical protein